MKKQTPAEYVASLVPSEHVEQSFLFQRFGNSLGKFPELALAFAVPNGGLRMKATAGKLKAEGVRSGIPDIILPVPRLPFHGLYLELKRQKASASSVKPEQRGWIAALRDQGYAVVVCRGHEEAYAVAIAYLASALWPREPLHSTTRSERHRLIAQAVRGELFPPG